MILIRQFIYEPFSAMFDWWIQLETLVDCNNFGE